MWKELGCPAQVVHQMKMLFAAVHESACGTDSGRLGSALRPVSGVLRTYPEPIE
jgi:hypothetical protein